MSEEVSLGNAKVCERHAQHILLSIVQVQAFTEAGSGAPSSPVSANTGVERPVPRLLLATVHALMLEDCDRRAETTLLRATATPIDLNFLHSRSTEGQGRVLWLTETQELRAASFDGKNKTKVCTLEREERVEVTGKQRELTFLLIPFQLAGLSGTALSLTVDWVGRAVYWSELDESTGGMASVVRRLQLDRDLASPVTVLRREGAVRQIAVAPLNSTLVWVEDGVLMTSGHDGSSPRRFFSRTASTERRRRACTCPANPRVGPALSLDHSDAGRPRVVWVDASDGRGGDVVAADLDACTCSVLVNARALREAGLEAGLPPSAVAADGERVYWANASLSRVYSAPKAHDTHAAHPALNFQAPQGTQTSHGLTARELSGVRRIAALGSHLQPYPAEHCLMPLQPAGVAMMVARNSTSVRLRLPTPLRPPQCRGVSMAPVTSTLYHGRPQDCGADRTRCHVTVTYDDEVDVPGLEPYTEHVFMVAQVNFYTGQLPVVPGPAVVFQTAAGGMSPNIFVQN